MSEVTWRGHPVHTYYEVSSDGRVRSLDRVDIDALGRQCLRRGRQIKTSIGSSGYRQFALRTNDGKHKLAGVHRIMCEAFHGLPHGLMYARHLNGDCLDNRIENIAWGTPQDNAHDCVSHGTNLNTAKTHCQQGHPFDDANTRHVTGRFGRPERMCKACVNAYRRRRYARLKQQASNP